MTKRYLFLLTTLVIFCFARQAEADLQKKIIYHSQFGSGYSLPALMVTALRQPDFIELPLVLSRDDVPVVYNDLLLEPHTNVAELFPDRHRADGDYYVVDFSLEELRRLSYLEDGGQFGFQGSHIASLEEVFATIEMIADEFAASSRFLPVIKYPWFHANEAKDISSVVLDSLIAHADSADATLYCMSFDPDELQRIEKDILPGLPVTVRLVQAIDRPGGNETMRQNRREWTPYNYEWLFTRLGLRVAAAYADALWLADTGRLEAPSLKRFITDSQGLEMEVYFSIPQTSGADLTAAAHELLVSFNADGLAMANPSSLHDLLSKWDRSGDMMPEAAIDRDRDDQAQDNQSEGLLSDPEGLLERLRRVR